MLHRIRVVLLVVSVALTVPSAEAQQARTAREHLRDLNAAIEARDNAAMERTARAAMAADDFASLSAARQHAVHMALAAALVGDGRCEEAVSFARRLMDEHPSLAPSPARLLFLSHSACDDQRSAAAALELVVQHDAEGLALFPDETIVLTAAYSDSSRLLSYLANGSWRPRDPTTDISMVRLALARAYLIEGQRDSAAEAAQALVVNVTSDLGSVVMLLSDKTFDPITLADPETFNLDAILGWQLASLRATVHAEPTRLAPIVSLADALYVRDRLGEALALVDETLARIAAAGDAAVFVDQAMQLNWLHEGRARIVRAQGDTEAALENLRQGAEAGERGAENVSQTLNRAAMLVHLGRAQEAVASLEDFDPANASSYGRGVARWVRACAYAQLGREAELQAALREAVARAEESFSSLLAVAICANDEETAASALVRHFDDPMTRRIAILSHQTFLRDMPVTDHERMLRERERTLMQRPEVRAAFEANVHERSYAIRRVH